MHMRRTAPIVLVTLILLSGCGVIVPQPNVNLALMPGTLAVHPSWVDGDPRSGGLSERTIAIDETPRFESPPTEAVVLFPTERTIRKIVIHSDEIMALDLYFETASNGWELNSKYAGLIGPKLVLNPIGLVRASGVKIRVTEGINDRAQRDVAIVKNGIYTEVRDETNVRVEIKEIQILGPGGSKAPAAPAEPEGPATGGDSSSPEDLLRDGLLK